MLLEAARWVVGRVILGAEALFAPRPPARSPEDQARVDDETSRLALYEFTACPYCVRVRRAMRRMGLNIERRDVRRNPDQADELRDQGGHYQVPCLRIDEGENVRWLYESKDIIVWLEQRFSQP